MEKDNIEEKEKEKSHLKKGESTTSVDTETIAKGERKDKDDRQKEEKTEDIEKKKNRRGKEKGGHSGRSPNDIRFCYKLSKDKEGDSQKQRQEDKIQLNVKVVTVDKTKVEKIVTDDKVVQNNVQLQAKKEGTEIDFEMEVLEQQKGIKRSRREDSSGDEEETIAATDRRRKVDVGNDEEDHTYTALPPPSSVPMEVTQDTDKGAVEKDERCPKCKRNVKSKAVICEDCFLWTHYRCLGKTEEQIKREFPDQFVCKECTDGKVE